VAVQGAAVGGGSTMLTHCDFVYAGESARFQLPFIDRGLGPEFGSSFSIPARVGHLRAAELFLLGEPFTAARATELGLVTRVVPDKDLLATATATAQTLAAKPSGALRASKRLITRASIGQLREAEKRKQRVRRAASLGGSPGGLFGVPREASAREASPTARSSLGSNPQVWNLQPASEIVPCRMDTRVSARDDVSSIPASWSAKSAPRPAEGKVEMIERSRCRGGLWRDGSPV
jgi:enoyl-CoA hydratase/isomerase-like protein